MFVCVAKKDVQDLLKASGVAADDTSLDLLISKMEGKSIPDLIAAGSRDLASISGGGAAPAGGAAAASAGPAKADEQPKAKEVEVEADVDMGGLFEDDGY